MMPPAKSWTGRQFPDDRCQYCNYLIKVTNLNRKASHLEQCSSFAEHVQKLRNYDPNGELKQIPDSLLSSADGTTWINRQFPSQSCQHCNKALPEASCVRKKIKIKHLKTCDGFRNLVQTFLQQGSTTDLDEIPKDVLESIQSQCTLTSRNEFLVSSQITPTTLATPVRLFPHPQPSNESVTTFGSVHASPELSAGRHNGLNLTPTMNSTMIERPTLHPEPWSNTDLLQDMQSLRCDVRCSLQCIF